MSHHLKRKLFTAKEYYKLFELGIIKSNERVELINGDVIIMNPVKSSHVEMVDNLNKLAFRKFHKKAITRAREAASLDEKSVPQPDISIAQISSDNYAEAPPEAKDIYLIIEVSESSLDKDRLVKHPLYAKAGIPEYWIVNLVDKQVEIHRKPKNGDYHYKEIISEEGLAQCVAIDFAVQYADIFKFT